MESERIEEIFAPVAKVAVKRMFGGHGVYADGVFFAIVSDGEIFLKADAATQPEFIAAGSFPFAYERAGKTTVMSYWRLVESAYDDEEELRRWTSLALAAARRAQASGPGRSPNRRRRVRE